MGASLPKIVWQPQEGPQTELIKCPVFEVFYGGARGGGKTEGSIGDFLEHAHTYGEHANGIFVRRTAKQLEEVINRTQTLFKPLGGSFRTQKSEWTLPNGARLKFRYLEKDADAEEYQGHSYTWLGVEEVTNFPSPGPIDKMRATLRSGAGAKPRMVLTGNPGGPGHQWVKARYIAPCKTGYKILKEEFKNPFNGEMIELERVFIPSKLNQNPLLLLNDPAYVARLQQQGSKQLVKAWLEGDWDIVLGAFFDCFDPYKHILAYDWIDQIPKDATRFRAADWGSAKPFSIGWYAVSDGNWGLPRNALVKYREWYGSNGRPNEGLKLFAEDVAEGIKNREQGEFIRYGVMDPSAFTRDGGPSIAERMLTSNSIAWKKADNKRVAGWDQLRHMLLGRDGVPLLYFLETCQDTIRTLPVLQHDDGNLEDVDTDGEDHAGDETRYAVMSRPFIGKGQPTNASIMQQIEKSSIKGLTFGELKKRHLSQARANRQEQMQ